MGRDYIHGLGELRAQPSAIMRRDERLLVVAPVTIEGRVIGFVFVFLRGLLCR